MRIEQGKHTDEEFTPPKEIKDSEIKFTHNLHRERYDPAYQSQIIKYRS
jgi:hypothetical protein